MAFYAVLQQCSAATKYEHTTVRNTEKTISQYQEI